MGMPRMPFSYAYSASKLPAYRRLISDDVRLSSRYYGRRRFRTETEISILISYITFF